MGADAVEHVAKVGEGVGLESFAGGEEAGKNGGGSPAFITAEKQPAFPSEGNSPQASLSGVLVYLQVSILAAADHGFAVLLDPSSEEQGILRTFT